MLDSKDSRKGIFRFDLSGKIVVVTGGAGILGRLYCERLAEAGAEVVVADLDQAQSVKLAQQIQSSTGRRTLGVAVDLTQELSVRKMVQKIYDVFGRVDVLVNNAATKSPHFFASLENYSLDEWNHVMGVNVTGVFLTAREIGLHMAASGRGSIINVSSIYGIVGPDQRIYEGSWYDAMGGPINTPLIYSATKGAVVAMTRYMATYWGKQGVRTNTLTPGGVSSGQNTTFSEKYSSRVPMGRMAEAEEMVGALIFLASDASSYVNGQNIIVDGGWTAW